MKYVFLPIQKIGLEVRHQLVEKARRGRYMKRYYTRKEAGLCVHCGAPAAEGKSLCPACLEYEHKRNSIFYGERKARGECINCGEPLTKEERQRGNTMCAACREKRNVRRRKKKEAQTV